LRKVPENSGDIGNIIFIIHPCFHKIQQQLKYIILYKLFW